MISTLILMTMSLITGYFFLRIGINRLITLPILIIIAGSIITVSGFETFASKGQYSVKKYGAKLSRSVVIIGLFLLLLSQGLVRYQITAIITILTAIPYYLSYAQGYHDGIQSFSRGIITTFVISGMYLIRLGDYHLLPNFLTLSAVLYLTIAHTLPLLNKSLTNHLKEYSLYYAVAVGFYRLFVNNINALLVSLLAFVTLCIALRQTYLGRKKEIQVEKKDLLSGRSILAGQKVLERYDYHNQALDLHIFHFLIQKGFMPSPKGIIVLQYSQIILILMLIVSTIYGLYHHENYVLLRYRLGILCFIITLFGIRAEEKFIPYYKTITIILLTGSYYITLFTTSAYTKLFTWGSFIWVCINMLMILFYNDLFPWMENILTKKDLMFWLLMIILSALITTTSLIRLSLDGSLLFALGTIIIGLTGYFVYYIQTKYRI